MKQSLESVDPWMANKLQNVSQTEEPSENTEEPSADC